MIYGLVVEARDAVVQVFFFIKDGDNYCCENRHSSLLSTVSIAEKLMMDHPLMPNNIESSMLIRLFGVVSSYCRLMKLILAQIGQKRVAIYLLNNLDAK